MALINYSNRDVTKFLVSNNPDIGPGSYEVKSSYQNFDKKFKNVKPPPFGKGSGMSQNQTNINSYLREHHYTPGPGQYDTKKVNSSFDSQVIVNVDQEQGVYFVVKNGALQKKTQMLAADKTKKGFDVINQSMKINNPGPGAYTPINLQKSFEKIGMQKQNPRNLSPRTGLTNKQYKSVSISKDPIGENGQQNNQYKLTSVPSIQCYKQYIDRRYYKIDQLFNQKKTSQYSFKIITDNRAKTLSLISLILLRPVVCRSQHTSFWKYKFIFYYLNEPTHKNSNSFHFNNGSNQHKRERVRLQVKIRSRNLNSNFYLVKLNNIVQLKFLLLITFSYLKIHIIILKIQRSKRQQNQQQRKHIKLKRLMNNLVYKFRELIIQSLLFMRKSKLFYRQLALF